MKFNFTKFEGSQTGPKKARGLKGLRVYDGLVSISEDKFKPTKNIDVYLDLKQGAIKILNGDTYKLTKISKGGSSNYYGFSSARLIKKGLKKGFYKPAGYNTFVLDPSVKLETTKKKKRGKMKRISINDKIKKTADNKEIEIVQERIPASAYKSTGTEYSEDEAEARRALKELLSRPAVNA